MELLCQINECLLICALSLPAFGQIQVHFESTNATAQSTPDVCYDEAAVLSRNLAHFPHPKQWTFIIACDEIAWDKAMRHIGIVPEPGTQIYGETTLSEGMHITFLRGPALLTPPDPRVTGGHIIAHELSHIYLKTQDEAKADAQADKWIRDSEKKRTLIAKAP
jgi:hypothetical protein